MYSRPPGWVNSWVTYPDSLNSHGLFLSFPSSFPPSSLYPFIRSKFESLVSQAGLKLSQG